MARCAALLLAMSNELTMTTAFVDVSARRYLQMVTCAVAAVAEQACSRSAHSVTRRGDAGEPQVLMRIKAAGRG